MQVDLSYVQIITDEEYMIVKKYALLPFVLKALQYDRKILIACRLKFLSEYIEKIDETIHRCEKAIIQNRHDIFYCHMKIHSKDWLHHELTVDGQTYQLNYRDDDAVRWIMETADEYLERNEN